MRLRSGLCDGHSNTLTFFALKPFCHNFGSMLGVIVHLEDPFTTSWLMSWDVASIYPHNIPTSWCHLFWEVHQSLLQQSTPTTWCCHPRASRLRYCSSACKPPPFSSKHNDGRYGQTVFVSSDQRTFLQKAQSLSPCAVANHSLAFFMAVFEQWFLPCWAAFQVMMI